MPTRPRSSGTAEGLIARDPKIHGGAPVIAGTRLKVSAVASRLSHGENIDDLLREYPYVTREQIEAAVGTRSYQGGMRRQAT